jgi:hypothetical protein
MSGDGVRDDGRSGAEERLARLLKQAVPEPPVQLSADQIMTSFPSTRPPARSWTVPALAAGAVVAIGVTTGLVATHRLGGDAATPTGGNVAPGASGACGGHAITVPNVLGVSMNAAMAVIQDAGFTAGFYDTSSSAHAPSGTVVTEQPAAGGTAVPGALVWLGIAVDGTPPPVDPFEPTARPTPSPCQSVTGTPAPADFTQAVPNVIGMTSGQAMEAAHAAGFSVSRFTAAPPASKPAPPGTVFAQVPAAGSLARPGSGMILYVASGGASR